MVDPKQMSPHARIRNLSVGEVRGNVTAQLGHKDAVMTLRIYGKFVPVAADFERVNAAIEAEEARAAGMLSAIAQAIAQGKPIDLSVLECTRLETDCGKS
jgi:hypothetical protein